MSQLNIIINGDAHQCQSATSVKQLLDALGYDCSKIALAINQNFVPRSAYTSTYMSSDDELDVVAAVQGG